MNELPLGHDLARVPWPTGKCFDLDRGGCLYCLLRSCVLAVRGKKYYELLFMFLIVAMSSC